MSSSPATRPSLLLRIRNPRDEQAWCEFVEIYEPLILRLARQRGMQEADARELTQEVLLAVAGAIDRWNPDPERGSFRGWLARVTRNLLVNFLARQRRQPRGVGDSDFQRWLEERPAPESAESRYFDMERKRRLFRWAAQQVRTQFQAPTWQAFWQTCVEGREIADVANEQRMSVGAVYVARSRVMASLRKRIEQAGGD